MTTDLERRLLADVRAELSSEVERNGLSLLLTA